MTEVRTSEKVGLAAILAIFLAVGSVFALQASFWFRVSSFDVHNATGWQAVTVSYDRDIRRNFHGAWRVQVWKETEDGRVSVCATEWTPQDYTTDAALPEPVTWEWMAWTEPRCYRLPAGNYTAEVTWRINPGSWLFEREIRRADGFTVF